MSVKIRALANRLAASTLEPPLYDLLEQPTYYAPAPVGEAGALGGHRRLSSVRLSI